MVGGDCDRDRNQDDADRYDADAIDEHRPPSQVRRVYDRIAAHFSKTRAYPWPEVEEFLAELSVGAAPLGLDVGCGNGRHAALLGDVAKHVIAMDVSRALLTEARHRRADEGWEATLLQGDAAALPLEDSCVSVALYVATLHHLPDREARVRSLEELSRVLGPDGRALISAWSTAHDRFDAGADADTGFDTTVDWTLPGGETVPRFYHIYARPEFQADLTAAGLTTEDAFVSSGNCYAVVSGSD